MLDLWISPKLQESAEIERKVTRTNKGTLIRAKNIKGTDRKVVFLHFKRDFPLSEKRKRPGNMKVNEQ